MIAHKLKVFPSCSRSSIEAHSDRANLIVGTYTLVTDDWGDGNKNEEKNHAQNSVS